MDEIEDLLNQIRETWPKFAVSKENLQRPTQEFVVRFYEYFIQAYNEKTYVKGIPAAPFDFNVEGLVPELEPEERLFLRLSKFLREIEDIKFKLADIYSPTPSRTKNFITILTHFVTFIECLQTETDALESSVFTAKEETSKLLLEEEKIINEINEAAKNKAELIENQSLLTKEYKVITSTYEEIKALKTVKQKLYAEKRNQIENFKQDVQNKEYELKRLEDNEKDLLEQRITEKEHQNILNSVEVLKSETETLDKDDIDIEDGLKHEDKVLQHNEECIMILDKCDFNVTNVKKLISDEDELKMVLNTVDMLINTKLNPVKQQLLEKNEKLMNSKKQLKNLISDQKIASDTYASNLTSFSQEIVKFRSNIEDKSQTNTKIISDYENDVKKLKEDLDRYKKIFTAEYVRVSKIEKVVVDKFKDILIKFKLNDS